MISETANAIVSARNLFREVREADVDRKNSVARQKLDFWAMTRAVCKRWKQRRKMYVL